MQIPKTTSRSSTHLRSWQGIMVGYEESNQWKIYNLLTKKVHISRNVNFDEGFAYDASLNQDAKAKIGEFWSSKNDEELALEKKKWELEIISNNNN